MTPAPALWPDARTVPRERTVRLDRFLVVAVLVSSALRLPGLVASRSSDEAGFLLVARSWSPSADSLYGHYWVDRPPVLLAAYRWSDALLGPLGPRLLALLLAAVLVVAVHLLAARLTSTGTARVATVVTVALLADPSLSAWTSKGEVLGTPLVALSWLLLVRALDTGSNRAALVAGVCAMTACGFKQSLVGGLVFAVGPAGRVPGVRPAAPARVLRVGGRFAVGAALPVLACLRLARGDPGDHLVGVVPGGRLPRRRVGGARRQ